MGIKLGTKSAVFMCSCEKSCFEKLFLAVFPHFRWFSVAFSPVRRGICNRRAASFVTKYDINNARDEYRYSQSQNHYLRVTLLVINHYSCLYSLR